jgi:uncharacterized protein with NRDE domain
VCLILLANEMHPRYRLVVAANRDEFYERPTAAAHWWGDDAELLAGKDLRSGGTWLGVTRNGRFAAITNYREPGKTRDDAPSRGQLVLESLTATGDPLSTLEEIRAMAGPYNGFNLLVGDPEALAVYSNRGPEGPRLVERGVFGLSNHLFDTPWPKVRAGRERLEAALQDEAEPLIDRLLASLRDCVVADDSELPDTGVGLEFERVLSPSFIRSPVYGTRASYVLLFDRNGEITFVEQSFEQGEPSGKALRFDFRIESR